MNRKVSVALLIEDMSEADILWDAHKNNKTVFGSKVLGIAKGNFLDDKDAWERRIDTSTECEFSSQLDEFRDMRQKIAAMEQAAIAYAGALDAKDLLLKTVRAQLASAEAKAQKFELDQAKKEGIEAIKEYHSLSVSELNECMKEEWYG